MWIIIVSLYVGWLVLTLSVWLGAAMKRGNTVGIENDKYTNVVRVTRGRVVQTLFVGLMGLVMYLAYVGIIFS